MIEELNIIDNTSTCVESVSTSILCDNCIEEANSNDEDRPKSWYVLPIFLENKKLFDMSKIEDISYSNLNNVSLITITYKKPYKYFYKSIAEKESSFYNDFDSATGINITFKIPEEHRCVCNAISRIGYGALNTHLIKTYFLKLIK